MLLIYSRWWWYRKDDICQGEHRDSKCVCNMQSEECRDCKGRRMWCVISSSQIDVEQRNAFLTAWILARKAKAGGNSHASNKEKKREPFTDLLLIFVFYSDTWQESLKRNTLLRSVSKFTLCNSTPTWEPSASTSGIRPVKKSLEVLEMVTIFKVNVESSCLT